MKSELIKDTSITPGICLKISSENEAEKVFINELFGNVNLMGDIDFATTEKDSKIEEIILFKLEK